MQELLNMDNCISHIHSLYYQVRNPSNRHGAKHESKQEANPSLPVKTLLPVQLEQKMSPQTRQWCRREKMVNGRVQDAQLPLSWSGRQRPGDCGCPFQTCSMGSMALYCGGLSLNSIGVYSSIF